jgi:hypothetical protein
MVTTAVCAVYTLGLHAEPGAPVRGGASANLPPITGPKPVSVRGLVPWSPPQS